MKKMMFAKAAVFLLLFAGLTAGVSAQVTISGGFALSSATLKSNEWDVEQEDTIGVGGNVYLDYLLPINIPLSLGVEIGFDGASTTADDGYEDKITAVPLLLRVAYHFDIMPKLDLYVVGKIGYAFGTWSGDTYDEYSVNDYEYYKNSKVPDPAGFAFGFDVGAAYYFTPKFGIFVEAGFDQYALNSELSGEYWDDYYYGWTSYKFDVELPFNRFLTLGISTKF
ncbi:MAG: porin family protein [Treponema sp.]|jgi:hypothetical protein|nr:porin family protein [Treponema sp.]